MVSGPRRRAANRCLPAVMVVLPERACRAPQQWLPTFRHAEGLDPMLAEDRITDGSHPERYRRDVRGDTDRMSNVFPSTSTATELTATIGR